MLGEIRQVLVNLYEDRNSIERILSDSGVNLALIDLDGAAINVWHNALKSVRQQNKLDDLLLLVKQEFPQNQDLQGITITLDSTKT